MKAREIGSIKISGAAAIGQKNNLSFEGRSNSRPITHDQRETLNPAAAQPKLSDLAGSI
jgi:hypothetical protein